ncbi:hypothetical protein N8J89_06650 [Crossiella sp. CA-258035]|uniref:nSTAND1 domain-containing NTPase n=1 Tax=Crossiella sp. CA-258035 TaxID=2981138 RepID=UPI0024BD47F0|nr:hypothetical protein [Crossiella sp. CA-258035]WHT20743.1 hypothetical protein N8J89_06650 [Crossiella sp. CA-258035]
MSVASGARAAFAERFALLYAEAGDPPLKRVAESVARARRTDERGRPVQVTTQRISDWRRGRNVPARFAGLAVVLEILIGEARARRSAPVLPGLYDRDGWRELWSAAQASPVEEAEPPPDETLCPYRGLAAFQPENSPHFFGRERATAALLRLLRAGDGLAMLVGASGAGKSSLLRAGLVPALAGGAETADWPVTLLTPGVHPVKELDRHLPGMAEAETAAQVREALGEQRRVIIVDQFEEVFTLCPDQEARRTFIRLLHLAATEGPALVVLGLRADFYGRCLDHPELVAALQDRHLVLGPMTVAELRAAVTAPARAVGLQLETGLVELLMRDLGVSERRGRVRGEKDTYDAGALPLLSHALLATWQHRQGGRLTVAGYRAAGGIQGAVAATAERAWAELDAAGQAAARPLLLRLVRIGEDTEDTRRRASRDEVLAQAPDRAATETALETLVSARLVTLDAESVEITHEALLRAWPRLHGWLDQDREGHLTRQRLEEDAKTWAAQHRDASLLYRGARLQTSRQAVAGAGPSELARQFLATSTRQWRRAVWLRRAAVAAVCVLALIASVAAVVTLEQRDEAQFRQVMAEADRVLDTDPSLSAQLSLVAHQLRPGDTEVRSRVLATQQLPLATGLTGHNGAVYLTSFSPDGRTLATAGYDGTARLWDVTDQTRPRQLGQPLTGHTKWLSSAVFSPDGRTLATTGADNTIRLWDVTDPARARLLGQPLNTGGGTAYLLAFSPDGRTLATANEDQTARLWDVRDPARPVRIGEPLAGHSGQVRSLAFSPDGTMLATGSDDTQVRLWDVRDPARVTPIGRPLTGHLAGLHSVAFSPDGKLLASGSDDKTIRLWDLSDPAAANPAGPPVVGHSAQIWSVAFSRTQNLLASASADGTARLWNISNPAGVTQFGPQLTGRNNELYAVAFSPDGRSLAVGGEDGAARLWSLPSGALVGHAVAVGTPEFRPDGRVLASGGGDRTIRLWDVADPNAPKALAAIDNGHTDPVWWVTFRGDGKVLASASTDRTIRLWDVTDPAKPVPLGAPIPGAQKYSLPIRFSPDGKLLAAPMDHNMIQLIDVSDPARPRPLGTPTEAHTGSITSLRFTPDGRTLVSASDDHRIRLWDVTDPVRPAAIGEPLSAHTEAVRTAELSPDGKTLASGGGDNTIRLWDLSDPRHPVAGKVLTGHTESVNQINFSPDGKTLVSGSADRTVRRWSVPGGEPVGVPLTTSFATWSSPVYSPGGQFLVTPGSDNTLRLWDLNLEDAQQRVCARTRDVLTEDQWRRHLPQLDYEPPCPDQ